MVLNKKKQKIKENRYSKNFICCKFQDNEITPIINAIYNSINY